MDLFFEREQTDAGVRGVRFKLWAKIEPDAETSELLERYRLRGATLIIADESALFRQAAFIGAAAFLVGMTIGFVMSGAGLAMLLGLVAAGGAGYWWINEKRETIFVSDLLDGRNFKCKSVVELAQKEAWLQGVVTTLRQVLETSKHWDGRQAYEIPVLAPAEAKDLILKL